MEERNYQRINLNREVIEATIQQFAVTNAFEVRSLEQRPGGNGLRAVVGKVGIEDSMLDIHFNQCGTCTLQYMIGKNRELGKAIADTLYETIHPDEFNTVNLVLIGIYEQDIEPVFEELLEQSEHVERIVEEETPSRKVSKLTSKTYQDSITVTHHKGTHKLQIQGKPLSCYREFVYFLTELLDLSCLDKVLIRQDDSSAEIVRVEMAVQFLESEFGEVSEKLPQAIRKLLLSSICVKLATPVLPDYSLLLYPDLRSLEGAVKDKLTSCGIEIDGRQLGDFFSYLSPGSYALSKEYSQLVADAAVRSKLGDAYSWYHKHRHGLFHMADITDGSRLLGNFEQLIALSKNAHELIKEMYK
ncbi:type II toxin-antitoxin system RnlA family toxin [Vibrio parahaemolyticus]|uniref:type II toxin-antitoxin system RnlA family toxin n=1 Tax=Vibrio TaxID=662 RepID=UPI001B8371E7|nr:MULTISPECIES: type II toxin-antitoxin system RnlA family toxin [Vibrio]MCC3831442.1 type II toxin-antitoxin system RnlA family toxin [Vibrio parahaemolyticus]MDF4948122.1 type II toxin-antitoxin system RnlA family toxin [Vibrio parahaemolyticus]MDF5026992.1 type II toxin-antitoxin system RnlA family toxin [Vibrio parahaemolyticus]MDF5061136.1 type II toxin-antitoxin system RnlA family toxin [Vibrio parahaemolyticus]MDF5146665.1 type II toxin-antitoxin system RnlA family toxin [Vibrio paraha